jgi:HD-GYP domain-containing protein (c-di-GMP phosphodiesterase class II)
MSSPHPSGVPSTGADALPEPAQRSLAAVIEERGEPLLAALEQRVPGSARHADTTSSYAFAAAAGLGLDRATAEAVRAVARIHEIGKLYVPAESLSRPSQELTTPERDVLRRQWEWGYSVARGAGVPELPCDWIRWAGERPDGTGPGGLTRDAIPLEARVIHAACMADRLWTGPTAAQIPAAERQRLVVGTLRAKAGDELDAEVVEALADVLLPAVGG